MIYAVDYDTNSNKSLLYVLILAMMPCVRADELAGDHLCYVTGTSVKYLGVVLDATKYFECLLYHRVFNSIFDKSKAANSEIVTVE